MIELNSGCSKKKKQADYGGVECATLELVMAQSQE